MCKYKRMERDLNIRTAAISPNKILFFYFSVFPVKVEG